MALTLVATDDSNERSDRCADCGSPLPERSPTSPKERRCQDCWWADQNRRYLAGAPIHPLARTILRQRHSHCDDTTPPDNEKQR